MNTTTYLKKTILPACMCPLKQIFETEPKGASKMATGGGSDASSSIDKYKYNYEENEQQRNLMDLSRSKI